MTVLAAFEIITSDEYDQRRCKMIFKKRALLAVPGRPTQRPQAEPSHHHPDGARRRGGVVPRVVGLEAVELSHFQDEMCPVSLCRAFAQSPLGVVDFEPSLVDFELETFAAVVRVSTRRGWCPTCRSCAGRDARRFVCRVVPSDQG